MYVFCPMKFTAYLSHGSELVSWLVVTALQQHPDVVLVELTQAELCLLKVVLADIRHHEQRALTFIHQLYL